MPTKKKVALAGCGGISNAWFNPAKKFKLNIKKAWSIGVMEYWSVGKRQ